MRGIIAGLVLLLIASFSGCIDLVALGFGGESIVVNVPPLSHGESWTVQSQSQGKGGDFAHSLSSTESSQVEDGRHGMLDAYALRVDAYLLTIAAHDKGHFEMEGDTQDFDREYTSTRAIEAAQGNWLTHGMHQFTFDFNSSFNSDCRARIEDTSISYAREKIAHDFFSLRGHRLTTDSVIVKEHRGTTPLGGYQLKVTFDVSGQETIPVTWRAEGGTAEALVVEVTREFKYDEPKPTETAAPKGTTSNRLYYVDGVGVPVKSRWSYTSEAHSSTSDSDLKGYTAGTKPLEFGGDLLARFDGAHPSATLAPMDRTPNLAGIPLELSFSEAERLAMTSSSGAEYSAWRVAHPESIASQGEFSRDPQRQIYSWTWTETDGNQAWRASATRDITAGLPMDRGSVSKVGRGDSVDPARAREVVWVDVATAANVAQAFMPQGEKWDELSWYLWKHDDDKVWPTLTFSALETTYSGGVGPVKMSKKTVESPRRGIDPQRGALAGGGGAGMSCGSGLMLDLPI